ncbi:P-loop containing nucleoside triphosphate hydrolase protein [Coccomyxa subellipsoidea C-169]|uniref:RNA helicase n=1 Tax=Coccomyxa subellipsoidea (strain C-169) TaxID=574566 RepID=I0YLV5_COCSC|nr:P-loop containing nucleoside triphosphate hydrolase protein [Coccomyxa subellipsoidea C-169]EIE19374.1 P-loop containing nucleoside triphosphate hydrolase protein [Coccomyxa subellipsoidea C-169]|eukprot:XP_005643918.1 P-loop containing nucleoside triphosphate hydrolase protein [Coccomyxa subellipsoidea C-169]
MADRNLDNWVSDQLYALLGFAESAVVSYVVSLGRKASNAAVLARQLEGQGLPSGMETRRFAEDLLAKIPRAGAAPGRAALQYQQRERDAAAFVRKNAAFAMLEDDEDDFDEPPPAPTTAPVPKVAKKSLRKSKDSDAEGGDAPDEEQTKRLAEEKDARERDEFAERLRQRDEAKTRKLAEAKLSKEELADIERRKYETEAQKRALVPELRGIAREEYLKKREVLKLSEMKDALEDEEMLFAGQKLTEKEQRELEYNRQVYELAMLRKKQEEELENRDEYHMPTSYDAEGQNQNKRYEVLSARYREVDEEDEATPWKEQENWEVDKIKTATMKVGSKDRAKKAQEYDFVFEDQIDFIKDMALAGDVDLDEEQALDRERKEREDAAKSEFERLQADRKLLPIFPYREQLLQAVAEHQIVIIVGETGSGKTTQIPQYLHEAGYSKAGRIGCTQPRRVAAMSVSARVATEVGCKLGSEVGYSIRFEDCTSDKTVLKYMTDGMLLREFLGEPDLATYSVMMVDEAHERTLHTDVLFGLVKDIARFRPDLKLLISSATLDAEKFSEYFDYAPIFRIPGRRYPVDILYTKAPEADYLHAAVVTTLQIHVTQPPGDVLIFLTGQEEIETAEELLRQRTRGLGSKIGELIIAPIYANLPSDLQAKIFETTPVGARKVVLATNIAETSLTIDGIKYVIDPGFCKQNAYSPKTGMESLVVTPVSKASAQQRAGRAGRTSPGKCFRLYTAYSFQHELEDNTIPEIQRTNLGNVVLMLKSLGINDLMNFDFMDPPPTETLFRALEQLYALGALNDRGELTKLGRRMAEFPLDPMLAKMLIASEDYKCSEEAASVAAMLGVGGAVFYRPKDKAVHADNAHRAFHRGNVGDHIALLNVFNAWAESGFSTQWCYENFVQVRSMKRARDIREQLLGLMERVEIELTSNGGDHDIIRKAIAAGFFYHSALLQKNGTYRTVKNPQTVHIHPSSGLVEVMPRWVIYHELVMTTKEFMRTVSEIKPAWLIEIAPHYYSKKELDDPSAKKLPKGVGRAAAADL